MSEQSGVAGPLPTSTAGELILVTGATGYIGGRLVPILLQAGYRVRVVVRHPERLRDVPWAQDVEVVQGDLLEANTLARACDSVDAAYYLAHAMGSVRYRKDFDKVELAAVKNFAGAARDARVRRIVYLGGLHPDGQLSQHLRSRALVGETLLSSGIPTIALQAGVVIGSGSASFEMIRHLSEVLPAMPAPRWVKNRIQPIAIRDVLYYLVWALELPKDMNRSFDIGGPDVLTYAQMMNGYATQAGLPRRIIVALPVLSPRLAAHWVNLVTPIPRSFAIPLVESLQNDCVVRDTGVDHYITRPDGGLTGYRRAVMLALEKMNTGQVETSWQDRSVDFAPSDPLPTDPEWSGHRVYTDTRIRSADASVDEVWRVIESVGGERGWYSFPLAWSIRGWIDKIVGGVGLRRGRRNPDRLQVGEAVDFWRVERLERGRLLRLRAEMKVPGRAWLEMSVAPSETARMGETRTGAIYHQRAVFFPRGLWGRLYWYAILPFHGVVFSGMANRIVAAATNNPVSSTTDETL